MNDIAIIGWGSLIWDLDDLAPRVRGVWEIGSGPELPLEFSRVSAKRLGALAVVIDPEHGALCPSHWIRSRRTSLKEARADLAARERAPIGRIGAVAAAGPATVPIARTMQGWCRANGLAGAVWTDLERNFHAEVGASFSLDRAMAYLCALEGVSAAEAARYITNAPATTDTPLRRMLAERRWWQTRVAALG